MSKSDKDAWLGNIGMLIGVAILYFVVGMFTEWTVPFWVLFLAIMGADVIASDLVNWNDSWNRKREAKKTAHTHENH